MGLARRLLLDDEADEERPVPQVEIPLRHAEPCPVCRARLRSGSLGSERVGEEAIPGDRERPADLHQVEAWAALLYQDPARVAVIEPDGEVPRRLAPPLRVGGLLGGQLGGGWGIVGGVVGHVGTSRPLGPVRPSRSRWGSETRAPGIGRDPCNLPSP